ncbi:MAG TPA: sigma-70 family RNA polymerase sigma factor [Bryobacteraceae bacterium]|jgi:RNA polymerase sigma-70 factor (ECF subfamily)
MEPLALLLTATGMDNPEDRARTVAAAKAGDLQAFELLLRQHERLVLATALRLLGNLDDAQDAAQEVFLKLHRNLAKVQLSGNLTAWLYRVTVNVCHDHHRRRPETTAIDEAGQLPGTAADPHQELADAERKHALDLSLRRLSERERTALVLRDLEGLSTAEVAAALGSTEATVRSQISKARVKMKKFVDHYFRRRS